MTSLSGYFDSNMLPVELPAAPKAMAVYKDGIVITFADRPPVIVRKQFGTLLVFDIEPVENDE